MKRLYRSGVIFLHALHRGSYLVSRPAARIGTGRDHPSPHQTFLKKLHEHIEHRAGQWLGNGMLVSPPAGLIDPGAIGGERNAGHVVHGGKIVGQSYLLGIGDLANSVHQVQNVKVAAVCSSSRVCTDPKCSTPIRATRSANNS